MVSLHISPIINNRDLTFVIQRNIAILYHKMMFVVFVDYFNGSSSASKYPLTALFDGLNGRGKGVSRVIDGSSLSA